MPRRVILAIALACSVAHADSRSDAAKRAVALFEEGRALAAQGKDAEACDRFLQSFELEPALGTELNLADCLQRQGYLRRAWGYYDHVATVAKREGDVLRAKFARERADALVPQLATVVVKLADPSVRVTLNAREVVGEEATRRDFVDPGDIEVEATAPGRKTFGSKLTLTKGKTGEVSVPVLAAATVSAAAGYEPRRKRGWVNTARVLASLAVLDLGFAAVAVNTVRVRKNEIYDYDCLRSLGDSDAKGDDCRRRMHALHDWESYALTSTLIGVGLAGSAVLVYILAPRERVTIAPTVTANQIGATFTARF